MHQPSNIFLVQVLQRNETVEKYVKVVGCRRGSVHSALCSYWITKFTVVLIMMYECNVPFHNHI